MRINLRRRHDEDVQYRRMCLEKAQRYADLMSKYRDWVDNLRVEDLYALVGAVRVQRVQDLKDEVLRQGLQQLKDLVEYWSHMADQSAVDPLVYE